MLDFNARPACEKIAAEIDALTERNAFLLTSAETAQAKLAEARAENQAQAEAIVRVVSGSMAVRLERDAQEVALGEQKRVIDEMREFERTSKLAFEKRVAQVDELKAKLAEARGRLNIYLLERIVPVRHTDEYTGFVIVAATEARAREIAQGQARGETGVWVDADRTTCHIIPQGSEQVILTDYAAG